MKEGKMIEEMGMLPDGAKWLLEQWLDRFTGVIESMTEDRPSMTCSLDGEDEVGDGALTLEQRFVSVPEPMLWIGLPETVHQVLGGRVLAGAGLETSDAEENRATCLEMVEQSIGGLAGAITKKLGREVTREQAKPCQVFPSGIPIIRVLVALGETILPPIWIAFSPMLIGWVETKPVEQTAVASKVVQQSEELQAESVPVSRTFELLLDVALPVSISFGKTELAIKDVLKLTTGSIVELDRSVNEPVDIVVNNCTIARGEVVVVDGNYGVRINSIVSRKERLRTGGAMVAENRARVNAG